jgi:hypothetical protein
MAFEAVRRKIARESDNGAGLGLKRAHRLFDKRAKDLTDEQYLTVSGWLNTFPLLAAAYDLKERLYAIYEVKTPEEAWGEYLHWESTIPSETRKAVPGGQNGFPQLATLYPELLRRPAGDERLHGEFQRQGSCRLPQWA